MELTNLSNEDLTVIEFSGKQPINGDEKVIVDQDNPLKYCA